MLRGEKVVLRPPEMEDVDTLLRWINDREVVRHRKGESFIHPIART